MPNDPPDPAPLVRDPGASEGVDGIAQAFIAYYRTADGCSNCGGVPHSTTCFVGRFEAVLLPAPVGEPAAAAPALIRPVEENE